MTAVELKIWTGIIGILGTIIMGLFAFLTHRLHNRMDKHEERIDYLDKHAAEREELNGAITRIYDKIDKHQEDSRSQHDTLRRELNQKVDTIVKLLTDQKAH